MTSEAQNAANKKNASRSTGPKTEKGKSKSRVNAVKHGLTAKVIDLLPSEDRAEYDNRINIFVSDHPNLTASQMILVKRIVNADWKLDRLDLAQYATTAFHMRHATIDHVTNLRKNAEEVGRKLIFEPLDRCEGPEWREPITQNRIFERSHDYPKCHKFELERTVEGVDWLLDQWNSVRGMLKFNGFWHYPEKMTAIRLLGKRPEDVLEDSLVGCIFVACNIAHIKPWDIYNECFQAKLGVIGRPMFKDQVYHMESQVKKRFFPTDNPEVALRWLDEMAGEEVARLTKLKNEVLQPIADADRAEAVRRAMFDASPAGIAMTRYQGALTRELSRSLNDLMKQRKCDNEFGDVFEEVSDEKTPVATAPEPAAVVAAPVVERNEPIPQVVVKPAVTKNGPRLSPLPDNSVGFLDVSASRNESSDGGKGSKTDPKPPR